jgi:Zn-dependent M28 family amino/carboxypeptidase
LIRRVGEGYPICNAIQADVERPVKIDFKRIYLTLFILLAILWVAIFWYLRNPVFSAAEITTNTVKIEPARLESHVRFLTGLHPNRSYKNMASMEQAQNYIADAFKEIGYQNVTLQDVDADGRIYHNIITRFGTEKSKDIFVVGAHYDAAGPDNPGADDNASGIAALIELARAFKTQNPKIKVPIEFVAYTLEEPPFFASGEMGSLYHADLMKERGQNVVLMLSLEMIGFYSDSFLSQGFTIPLLYGFFPWTGNFIGIVGAPADRALQARFKAAMSANSSVPTLSITAPPFIAGVDFSDHRNYWSHDWPAFMITDTAFLRNNQYHEAGDTPDRLNYGKMAEVARGIYAGILDLVK